MRKGKLGSFAAVLVVAAVMIFCGFSTVQAEYPESPVSMIVPYSPGGATDFQARIVTMLAGKKEFLGQPIVIINKPGAGGQVGWNWCAQKAPKDGYTMLSYNVPHFIAQSIVFKTKYNIHTFAPVANWGADPAVLIVGKDSPFNSVQDLLDYAKNNPRKVTVSGAGLYVGHHILLAAVESDRRQNDLYSGKRRRARHAVGGGWKSKGRAQQSLRCIPK